MKLNAPTLYMASSYDRKTHIYDRRRVRILNVPWYYTRETSIMLTRCSI